MKWLKSDHHKETNETDILLQRLDAQIEMQKRRRNNLLDLRIDGEINEESYSKKKDEINTELKRLEKERAGVKYQSDDWLKRAEKRVHYALYARDKLENGDFEEKTNVLADLGSNFVLDHKILRFDLDSVLTAFKNNHETVNQSLQGFELEDKLLNQANSEILKSWLSMSV